MTVKLREPVSGLTHLAGAILSILALILLVYYAVVHATVWHIVAFSIFGASMILLYTASSLYHLLNISEKGIRILRKIDHMMIYVLIAGTYTPICLVALRGVWGWSLLSSVWVIALSGIIMKAVWMGAPRWLSTSIYTIMGWIVVIAFIPLVRTVPVGGIIWMVAGGLLYSIGAVIYGTKWPKINSRIFGFHEIFHLFVLGGSFCHFWLMYRYVLYLG
ncbi:PAQR family membrane homeostasis protein TrhA [Geosporobacter ferrireducens]|uniref:Hemolysin n=1 Tax=Geosporobacter ferrireducens TaxID=1424294 RepID=A0A1D8GDS2_9FIRM|nr:hemolysin III family protein [Geosporobacter ferrireducens]AOT69059.1 hemolysin [Geosporobacter ferrireducens]MTI56728.1 hemolysin III family protein [Geosporobacter ferrireducens]